jgi:2'-phosphotransferase
MEEKKKTQVSKKLSYYLRHHLGKLHCTVSPDGFVPVSALMTLKDFTGVTFEDIQFIVETCPKQRFSLKKQSLNGVVEDFIRANQGHSLPSAQSSGIDAAAIYQPITEPMSYCAHGTTREAFAKIQTSGIKRMNRTHIHFAQKPNAKSGFRSSSEVLVHIDMAKAMNDGIKFFLSDNGVILCDGIDGTIDAKYISEVEFR